MHDWYLANEILKTVLEYASKNGFKKVSKIEIELGSISDPPATPEQAHACDGGRGHNEEITPENLIYNFKLLSQNTLAESAELKIKKVKGENWKLISIEE
jgi:Zn finger protein HypA/HybF involved in hydrogenase expression